MLVITNGSQVEPLLESNYEKIEELNGTLQISFDSFFDAQNVGHNLIDFETIVTDEDGNDYIVKQIQTVKGNKRATAIHSFFSLVDDFKYDTYGGTHTFNEFASFAFAGTDWTFTVDTNLANKSTFIPNFGNGNVIKLTETLLAAFNCERKIMPNNTVLFAEIIGEDNDEQFRFKHNIKTISHQVNTTNLKTQIKGFGANGLEVTYTSPLATNERIGIRVAEPYIDDEISDESIMQSILKNELTDVPDTSIEVDVTYVDGQVGDYIWLIHEDLNFEYQTRILSKKTKRNYSDSVVEIGNVTTRTLDDVLISQAIEIDEHKKTTRSKILQTNDRITLEVEEIDSSIATLDIKANEITSSVQDLNNNLTSKITQTASDIRSELTVSITSVNGSISNLHNSVSSVVQTATSLQSTINAQTTSISNLATRVSTAESSITQTASQISSKVSYEDYTGAKITSLINQDPYAVSISASKINLNGATLVNGNITGMGTINISTDAYVGRNLYLGSHYTGAKKVVFNSATGIVGGDGITGDDMSMYGNDLTIDFAKIDASYVARLSGLAGSATDNLFLALNSANTRLYIRRGGSSSSYDVGYIPLTTT